MFWLMVTKNPELALTLDIVFFLLAIAFGTMLFYFRWRMGPWWNVAREKLVVLAIGRDKLARLIIPKTRKGQFLDLGRYGKILVDPSSVYRVVNMPGNQSIIYTYLPYAVGLDIEKLAGANMISRAKKQLEDRKEGKVRVPGGEVKKTTITVPVEDEQGNVTTQEIPYYVAEIKEPVQISVEDIENWQVYSYNPILLEVAVREEARATYGDQVKTIQQLRLMLLIVLVIGIFSFILSMIK